MTSLDFLRLVWPGDGFYCVATPYGDGYKHKMFSDVASAASYVRTLRQNVFFALHSFKETRVWNEKKKKWQQRTQANAKAVRCFYLDLDTADEADNQHYLSQEEAVADLREFCKVYKLPKPTVVSSGNGVHAYWHLEDDVTSAVWFPYAERFKALMLHHGLRIDPVVPADRARVLRVPGTLNVKPDKPTGECLVVMEGEVTPNDDFFDLLTEVCAEHGVVPGTANKPRLVVDNDLGDIAPNTVLKPDKEFDPVTMKELISACPQVMRQAAVRGKGVSEPLWYATLQLVKHTVDGERNCHKISQNHASYAPGLVDDKLAHLGDMGPTLCTTIADRGGAEFCEGCPFNGKVKTPLDAARRLMSAPAPLVEHVNDNGEREQVTITPPADFARKPNGCVVRVLENKDGGTYEIPILSHDLYPTRFLGAGNGEPARVEWCIKLPRAKEPEYFTTPLSFLHDTKSLLTSVCDKGVIPSRQNVQHLVDYMVAYIQKLQRMVDAEKQHEHLGWTDEQNGFVLPGIMLLRDGTDRPIALNSEASSLIEHVHKIGKRGTLQEQVDLMQFYDHPDYLANQFYIGCALASPLFFATGHHGVIVNAIGDPGASKSTSLYSACSMWGHPEAYALNGTGGGVSAKARDKIMSVLANLPVGIDEITGIAADAAKQFAMNVSQTNGAVTLTANRQIRIPPGFQKSSILLCTANNSMHTLLAQNNVAGVAGSMRVVEFKLAVPDPDNTQKMNEAARFLRKLLQNYGHIGEHFMRHAIQNVDSISERVVNEMENLNMLAHMKPGERLWSGCGGSAIVALQIAKEIGVLNYNPMLVKHWFLNTLVPQMRGNVTEEHAGTIDPITVLTDFLAYIAGETLVVSQQPGLDFANAITQTRGRLSAHADMQRRTMWVLRKAFRDYCTKQGADYRAILARLSAQRIVIAQNDRKVLGAGTEYGHGQAASYCFTIDLAHPALAQIDTGPKRAGLTLVKSDD